MYWLSCTNTPLCRWLTSQSSHPSQHSNKWLRCAIINNNKKTLLSIKTRRLRTKIHVCTKWNPFVQCEIKVCFISGQRRSFASSPPQSVSPLYLSPAAPSLLLPIWISSLLLLLIPAPSSSSSSSLHDSCTSLLLYLHLPEMCFQFRKQAEMTLMSVQYHPGLV